MRKKALLLIIAGFFWLPGISMAAPYIVVDEPALKGAVVLLDSLLGEESIDCVIGQGQSIYLFDGQKREELISDIPGRVTALALGDLTGNLRNDLAVGTDGAGALYLYSVRDGKWERGSEPSYLWDSIRRLEIHDFNNDGWGDVIALTDSGEVTIFLSWEGRLYPFWKSPAKEVVTNLQVLDINQDGQPNVVYALKSGYVGILTWEGQEFITCWENYPWGSIEDLVVIPVAGSPEWLVVTSQKMLYGWRWREGEVVNSRHFHASGIGEHLFYIPGEGLLSFSEKTGVSLFELHTASVSELWRLSGVSGCEVFYDDSSFIFRDCDFNYYRLVPDSGQWTISLDGQDITEEVEILTLDGQLLFNLNEMGPALGFSVYHPGDWYFLKDNHYLRIRPSSKRIEWNGLLIPFRGLISEKEGVLYAGSDIFPVFGWTLKLNPARRRASLSRNWGWWLP